MKILLERFSAQELRQQAQRREQIAQLYCAIWREPPWNELNWTNEMVYEEFAELFASPNPQMLCAYRTADEVAGFSWGFEKSMEKIVRENAPELAQVLKGGRFFYTSELAVAASMRNAGVGVMLTEALTRQVQASGASYVFLRTHKEAFPAQKVYTRCGFTRTEIRDVTYPDRTYWVRKLD